MSSEIEILQQRLAEAEGLLREALSGLSPFIGFGKRITDFLNQKGGDATYNSLVVEQQKKTEKWIQILIDEKEKLIQAASAAEERAERLQAEVDGLLQKLAESAVREMNAKEFAGRLQAEIDSIKSVRVLTGPELGTIHDEMYEANPHVTSDELYAKIAEQLQLRCTCLPMSGEELLDFCSSHWVTGEKKSGWKALANHIWPTAAPKSTREEVAAKIVEAFRNDVLTVITLDGVTASASNTYGDGEWSAETIGDNIPCVLCTSRDEAEQTAKDMLVDVVTENAKPVLTTVVQVVV